MRASFTPGEYRWRVWRRLHRWLAIVLVIPLIVWSLTGLLFHWKPGWSRAYDMLDAEKPGPLSHLDKLAGVLAAEAVTHVEMFETTLGPLARITTAKGDELWDPETGLRRSPLAIDAAQALAVDAMSRSPHHAAYGAIKQVSATSTTVTLELVAGPVVEIGRNDARLSQRGPDTERIEWLYRIHYLQWTGNKAVVRVLALVGLLLIWLVLIPGVVLFVRRP
jgi:uncharacterized iron-regulated membrane protein